MAGLSRWKERLRKLKAETYALYLAYKHPRTPWYAKVFAALVVGYAFSPIDLIPDFIPVLGYLDDLVLIPAGIFLAIKMIPRDVLSECRAKASEAMAEGEEGKRKNWVAAGVIIAVWVLLAALAAVLVLRAFKK